MRHFSNQVLTDANTKPKLEILSQDKFRGTNRSPDLVVCCSLIGLNLIYPIPAYFRIFLLVLKNVEGKTSV